MIKWADDQIESKPDVPVQLIELALMVQAPDVELLSKLNSLCTDTDPWLPIATALFSYRSEIKKSTQLAESISARLWETFSEHDYEAPSWFAPATRLDDAFALAKSGAYGTVQEAHQDMLQWIESLEHVA